jgi:hypothetical protein
MLDVLGPSHCAVIEGSHILPVLEIQRWDYRLHQLSENMAVLSQNWCSKMLD